MVTSEADPSRPQRAAIKGVGAMGVAEQAPVAVRIDALSVTWRGRTVLRRVCLEVPASGITVLLGPAGAGKSVLLWAINGLLWEEPEVSATGRIWLGATPIFPERRRDVAIRSRIPVVLEVPYLFPGTVERNLTLALRAARHTPSGAQAQQRLLRALDRAGLGRLWPDRMGERADRLSDEDACRLAVARALVTDPDIVLLDEPGSRLGPQAALSFEETLRRIGREVPLLVATQSAERAARLADTVAVIIDGELVEAGPVARVLMSPQDARTVAFLTSQS